MSPAWLFSDDTSRPSCSTVVDNDRRLYETTYDPSQTRRFIRSPGWIGGTDHFHSGAGDAWSTLRVQQDHLPRIYHAWQLPERFTAESRHTISGEHALTCFLARCATGKRWMTLEGVLNMARNVFKLTFIFV